MPYISTEEVSKKRQELKNQFPNYKFSITKLHHSKICVKILEAPIELRLNTTKTYEDINYFCIKDVYEKHPEICEVLTKIYSIIDEGNCTIVEDGDYGAIPKFYTDISVGSYEIPFKVVKKSIIKKDLTKTENTTVDLDKIQIIDYSEKAIAIIGDTKPIKELLKEMGGRFNFKLTCGPGWIFPMKKKETIIEKLKLA
jgi:hypothetical protein